MSGSARPCSLPDDWKHEHLGSLLSRPPAYGINAAASPYSPDAPTYIRITDIDTHGRFRPSPKVSVRHSLALEFELVDGDLVFARTGATVGKSYRYTPEDGRLVFAGFLIRIVPDPRRLDPRYLAYVVQSGDYWDWVSVMAMRSGQPGINAGEFARLPIAVPPLKEQQEIAETLSDADDLIVWLERLIAKKSGIKQGTMQQLLTGGTRLPGFEGEWDPASVGEITTWLSGGTPTRSRDDYWSGDIPWISAATLTSMEIASSDQHLSEAGVEAGSRMAPIGSTLLLVRGSALHNQVKVGRVVAPVCFNQDVKALVPKEGVDPRYLAYSFVGKSRELLGMVTSATNSAGVLDTKVVKAMEIPRPGHAEQEAIASVLSDMDAEIEALKARLTKTHDIKQGMMQELLTGRTRLPIPETYEASADSADDKAADQAPTDPREPDAAEAVVA